MRLSSIVHATGQSRSKKTAEIIKRFYEGRFLKEAKPEAMGNHAPAVETPVDMAEQLDSMISASFIRENSAKFDSYKRHLCAKESEAEDEAVANEEAEMNAAIPEVVFPYRLTMDPTLFDKSAKKFQNPHEELTANDRGFFVQSEDFYDDYVSASTADIPEDEMNIYPYDIAGAQDAVETIEFQRPYQMALPKNRPKSREVNEEADELMDDVADWKQNYDVEDPSYRSYVKIPCTGCGAQLHCADAALPGYVPKYLLKKIERRQKHKVRWSLSELCRRCYMLKQYNLLLNVNVCPVDYRAVMGHMKLIMDSLVLLVIDMTDIRGSIHSQLPSIIGTQKPMIIIGNKIDLLPPDVSRGYLRHIRDTLEREINAAGFRKSFNILSMHLVSAKTGFGIEDLITSIYSHWIAPSGGLRSDMYVIGCTNAGKSTLFNTFLQSDLCKVRATDLIDRVSTSIWPGTTLSLLKFPVMTPNPHRLELRRQRLLSNQNWIQREAELKRQLFAETGDPKYLALTGLVESTFVDAEKDQQPISNSVLNSAFGVMDEEEEEKPQRRINMDDPIFKRGRFCYDTPGTVSEKQILDMFTLEELINVLPRKLIIPRTFSIGIGESLLIGGVARIDLLDLQSDFYAGNLIMMTAFASERLPVRVMPTSQVDEYMELNKGDEKAMGAPLGDDERLKNFPPLKPREFIVESPGQYVRVGSADILLSSIGWVMITSPADATIKAYSPDGRGLDIRPPLLPNAAEMRGKKIIGTRAFLPSLRPKVKRRGW